MPRAFSAAITCCVWVAHAGTHRGTQRINKRTPGSFERMFSPKTHRGECHSRSVAALIALCTWPRGVGNHHQWVEFLKRNTSAEGVREEPHEDTHIVRQWRHCSGSNEGRKGIQGRRWRRCGVRCECVESGGGLCK